MQTETITITDEEQAREVAKRLGAAWARGGIARNYLRNTQDRPSVHYYNGIAADAYAHAMRAAGVL